MNSPGGSTLLVQDTKGGSQQWTCGPWSQPATGGYTGGYNGAVVL